MAVACLKQSRLHFNIKWQSGKAVQTYGTLINGGNTKLWKSSGAFVSVGTLWCESSLIVKANEVK